MKICFKNREKRLCYAVFDVLCVGTEKFSSRAVHLCRIKACHQNGGKRGYKARQCRAFEGITLVAKNWHCWQLLQQKVLKHLLYGLTARFPVAIKSATNVFLFFQEGRKLADYINSKNIKDISNSEQKYKGTAYLKKSAWAKIDSLIPITSSSSRNDVIEKAIDFYFAYTSSQLSQDYLCGVLGTKLEACVQSMGSRISRMLFKNAVELDVLSRAVASALNVVPTTYNKLRRTAVEEVKKTNGAISLVDAGKTEE